MDTAKQAMLALIEEKRGDAEFLHDAIAVPGGMLSDLFADRQDAAILDFLTSSESILDPFSGMPLVTPGKPANSALFLHITDPRGQMFQRFDDAEIEVVKRWIMSIKVTVVEAELVALSTIRIATGLTRPLYCGSPPGDGQRLFIVEKGKGNDPGRIKILNLATNEINDVTFLEIAALSTNGERGLLGLAFHPDYANNGQLFVNYTDSGGSTVVQRFTVSDNPDVADADSAKTVLTIEQPFSNHNGGCLAFGPNDGFLYIGTGDGGSGNDPQNNAQNRNVLLGKMLRLDVNGDDFPDDDNRNYAIPADNPFVGQQEMRPEIWAYGLRNPWRWSFDRETGDLYIADVGQVRREEIDFQPAASGGGENYGWRLKEGSLQHIAGVGDPPDLTDPIHEYPRADGRSITGGYVYRGNAIDGLRGTYFFADFHSHRVWSFRFDGQIVSDFSERTTELAPQEGQLRSIASFGEDASGEIYLVSLQGDVFKITKR